MKKIAILGGKGIASVIAHAIKHAEKLAEQDYTFAGFINDHDNTIDNLPVIGKFSDVPDLIEQGYYFINTVYKIGGQAQRLELFESLQIPDEKLFTFIHPFAYVSPGVEIGPGCAILPGASVSCMTKIGRCCLIMSNAGIGHDTEIGDFNFLTSHACVASYVKTGVSVWFGIGSIVRGKLTVGHRATVGFGAVVTKNIGDDEIWIGNPARLHKTNRDKINL